MAEKRIEWTEQQKRAIDARGGDVLVTASAGTGNQIDLSLAPQWTTPEGAWVMLPDREISRKPRCASSPPAYAAPGRRDQYDTFVL